VEQDLQSAFPGRVFYAKDAFAGLNLMDQIMAGEFAVAEPSEAQAIHLDLAEQIDDLAADTPPVPPVEEDASPFAPRVEEDASAATPPVEEDAQRPSRNQRPIRSAVDPDVPVPTPPFWGSRVVTDVPPDAVIPWIDEKALFTGRWGMRGEPGQSFDDWADRIARPRLRMHLERIAADGLADLRVVYGYWPVYASGERVVVLNPELSDPLSGDPLAVFEFPRQASGKQLCIADYFRDLPRAQAEGPDVIGLQLVTAGEKLSPVTDQLYRDDAYRDYLELHGVSVQLAEALAEYWHSRIRAELGFSDQDGSIAQILAGQKYRGERYSFGYPACPDLTGRRTIFDLLDAGRIGVQLSETFQLAPEQSTDALVVHHPQAHYFSVR
jgi:5-methyltetrahydrofolate--homocysteine methyltransferase